jgi:hypothetical protein
MGLTRATACIVICDFRGDVWSQSTDLYRYTTELVQHFTYRGVHIGVRTLLDINLVWFAYIALAYLRGEEVVYVFYAFK